MLRMLALAALLTVLSATAAHGGDGPAPQHGGPGDPAVASPSSSQIRPLDLRMPGAVAWARPSLRGALSGGRARSRTGLAARAVPAARNGVFGGLAQPGRERAGAAGAALAYTLSDRFSLNVGYGFLDVEDVVVRRGEPGAVDPAYTSHHLLLHARWRF